MCGSSPPDAPDMRPMAEASLEQAKIWEQVSMEQLQWAKEQGAWSQGMLEEVLGVQMGQMEEAAVNARKDRERYEQKYQPIEDDLIREFETYDTPQERERKAAEMMGDVASSYDAQRENATRRLEDYGVDPSQTRNMALDRGMRGQEGAMSALAGNQGRDYVTNMGRALRGEAINIGRGMPSQVAMSQGIVNQTAGGAIGNMNQTNAGQVGMNQGALGAAGMGQSYRGQGADIYGQDYQNRMGSWQAGQDSSASGWGGAASLAGTLGAAYLTGGASTIFMEDGGVVPDAAAVTPMPGDKYPAMLAEDEYVISADVVKRKGTEFFDKLQDKYQEGGEYEQKRQQALEVG